MSILFAIGLIVTITYLLIQFGRQEAVEEFYQEAIIDIEGRLDWARTRSSYPFGMEAQIDVSNKLLHQAKNLWRGNKYQQAYRVARQSQKAIDKAQNIYISAAMERQQSGDNTSAKWAGSISHCRLSKLIVESQKLRRYVSKATHVEKV